MEKIEVACVKFLGKNYFAWEFQFQIYVQGNELWGHLDGTTAKPTDPTKAVEWEAKDARIKSWILQTMEPTIAVTLRPYKTAKAMWDYLKKVYRQTSAARRFQLEYDISNYTQGNLSIQEYYTGFVMLWTEYTDLVYASVPDTSLEGIQTLHQTSQRDQFLMKLRHEFESVRSNLLLRTPSPSLDDCLNELLREEQRLSTQATLEQQGNSSNVLNVAYAAQGKQRGRDLTNTQCYSCKGFGHIASQCSQKFCNYCKIKGHIISECRKRPQNHNPRAFQTSTINVVNDTPAAATTSASPQPTVPVLTQENVQQMIISALSAFGLNGNNTSFSKLWLFDSGASNHMTFTSDNLINVKKYGGNLKIETASGDHLPITAIGDVSSSPSMQNAFISPDLSVNLLSVG